MFRFLRWARTRRWGVWSWLASTLWKHTLERGSTAGCPNSPTHQAQMLLATFIRSEGGCPTSRWGTECLFLATAATATTQAHMPSLLLPMPHMFSHFIQG